MSTAEKAPPATGNHGRSGSLGGIFLKREKRGFKQSAMRIVIPKYSPEGRLPERQWGGNK